MSASAAIVRALLEEEDLDPKDYADRLPQQGWYTEKGDSRVKYGNLDVFDRASHDRVGRIEQTRRGWHLVWQWAGHVEPTLDNVVFSSAEEAAQRIWSRWTLIKGQ